MSANPSAKRCFGDRPRYCFSSAMVKVVSAPNERSGRMRFNSRSRSSRREGVMVRYLINSGNPSQQMSATTSGPTPPIMNRICQPCVGTRSAATGPGNPPPKPTPTKLTMMSVARKLRGANSPTSAMMFGMKPPMPMPARSRSSAICPIEFVSTVSQVKMPKLTSERLIACFRPMRSPSAPKAGAPISMPKRLALKAGPSDA